MKKYSVKIQKSAQKALKQLDRPVEERILEWLKNTLEGCENPRLQGKPLHGNLKGNWRYRVGKYRIVADIQDDKVLIVVIDVDKRNDIYKN